MVRVKHRWFTVSLRISQDEQFDEAMRLKNTKLFGSILTQKSKILNQIKETYIIHAIRDLAESMYGVILGSAITGTFSITYWNPDLGIFVLKGLWAHDEYIRAMLPMLSTVSSIPVQPTVLCDCATFVQSKRFLIKQLHRWMGQTHSAIIDVNQRIKQEETKIQKLQDN